MFNLAREAEGGAGKALTGPGAAAKDRPAPILFAGDLVRDFRGMLIDTYKMNIK